MMVFIHVISKPVCHTSLLVVVKRLAIFILTNAILSCLKILAFLKYSFEKYVTTASRKNAAETRSLCQTCSLKFLARRIQ